MAYIVEHCRPYKTSWNETLQHKEYLLLMDRLWMEGKGTKPLAHYVGVQTSHNVLWDHIIALFCVLSSCEDSTVLIRCYTVCWKAWHPLQHITALPCIVVGKSIVGVLTEYRWLLQSEREPFCNGEAFCPCMSSSCFMLMVFCFSEAMYVWGWQWTQQELNYCILASRILGLRRSCHIIYVCVILIVMCYWVHPITTSWCSGGQHHGESGMLTYFIRTYVCIGQSGAANRQTCQHPPNTQLRPGAPHVTYGERGLVSLQQYSNCTSPFYQRALPVHVPLSVCNLFGFCLACVEYTS